MALDSTHFVKVNTWGDTPAAADPRLREEFRYITAADAVATVSAAGYFNNVRTFLQVGDIILAICSDGFRILLVATVPATGNVTVTNKAAA